MKKGLIDNDFLDTFNEFGLPLDGILSWYPRIIEPLAKPSDLGFTRREFFYWTEKRVIDVRKQFVGQSSWSRLNLIEIVWIKIAQELRMFNFPFSALIQLKEMLFENFLQNYLNNSDAVLKKLETNFMDEQLIQLFATLLEEERKTEPNQDPVYEILTPLGAMIAEILLLNRKITLLVYREGDEYSAVFEGYSLQQIDKAELDAVKSKTHLSLILNDLLAGYLIEENTERINKDFGFISEAEIEIIKAIRNKEVREINIKKDDSQTIHFSATSRNELKTDDVNLLKRILRMNEFDDVRVVLRNKKHIYLENKKRKKL